MVCVHPTLPSTRRRLGQFLPEADGQHHDGSRDQPRHYQPVRNRPRSPALNAAQRVLPIPFGLIEETKRDVVGHRAPDSKQSPQLGLSYPTAIDLRINDLLNKLLHSSGLARSTYGKPCLGRCRNCRTACPSCNTRTAAAGRGLSSCAVICSIESGRPCCDNREVNEGGGT
jgi:hypothetical protein